MNDQCGRASQIRDRTEPRHELCRPYRRGHEHERAKHQDMNQARRTCKRWDTWICRIVDFKQMPRRVQGDVRVVGGKNGRTAVPEAQADRERQREGGKHQPAAIVP